MCLVLCRRPLVKKDSETLARRAKANWAGGNRIILLAGSIASTVVAIGEVMGASNLMREPPVFAIQRLFSRAYGSR